MGMYVSTLDKPKACGECWFFERHTRRCRIAPVPSYKAYSDSRLTPEWCPIGQMTEEEAEAGRNLMAAYLETMRESKANGKNIQ